VELLEYLIELFSREGDLVLDTFAGSGSTGLAAQKRNRQFILIERDPKMFAEMSKQFAVIE
jgi:DNA modification methylase